MRKLLGPGLYAGQPTRLDRLYEPNNGPLALSTKGVTAEAALETCHALGHIRIG